MRTHSKMSHLSILSRGTGQVVRKKEEKLEVHFNPEDYLNWQCLETNFHDYHDVEGDGGLCLPKTYSTRTGALLLYSEDLAKPSRKLKGIRKTWRRFRSRSQTLHIELHTLQDLVRAILAYGRKQDKNRVTWQPYLHFLTEPDIRTDRQMRPGYSPKRYLLKLSQTWDPSILRKLQCAGSIRDPLLLEEDTPDHRKNQDLSAVPPKYNLLHIFCSPYQYIQAELEEEQAKPGLASSSQKQYEEKARLGESYEEGKHARIRARIPLRISVRKLSFHLPRQQAKEPTWSQHTAYSRIPEDRWVDVPRDGEVQGHSEEVANQSRDHQAMGKTSIDTSELGCEKSHVTFYGGFFPGKKITYSVNQKYLKGKHGRDEGTPVTTDLFSPIQPGTRPEQCEVMKEHRKQVPEICRLPQISEDSPRAYRGKFKSGKLPKEPVAFPLLVQLERDPEAKTLRGTSCNEPRPEVDVCDEHLSALPNDLILEPEHKNQQQQEEERMMINSEILEASQGSFHLPPINNGEFLLNGRKMRKKEEHSEKNSQYQRGLSSTYEHQNGTSLHHLPPDTEIPYPSLLGSVQTTDNPRHSGFIPDEEGDGELFLKTRAAVSISSPETPPATGELHGKEALKRQQAGKLRRNQHGTGNEQSTKGDERVQAESRKGDQRSQGGLCGNRHLLRSKEEEGLSSLPPTDSRKEKDVGNFLEDTEKQLDNLPQSASLSHLEPHIAHPRISAPDREKISESDSTNTEILDRSAEIEKSARMGPHSSEKHQVEEDDGDDGEEEEEKAMLPEKTRKPTKGPDPKAAASVVEDKAKTGKKKPESVRSGAVVKVQKKTLKKDKRTDFVVGKPKQKKAVGKTVPYSKEKSAGVKRSEAAEDSNQDEEKGDAAAEIEKISSLVEGEGGDEDEKGGFSDQSPPSSSPLREESLLPLEEGEEPSAEDVLHPSGPQAIPADETAAVAPADDGSQPDTTLSNDPPEPLDPPRNKQEEKLSREQMIADRAEKRRLAVERKRREQEERKRKEQEEQERMERMKEELEQEQQKRMAEMRLRKQQLEEERRRQEEEAARQQQAAKAAQEHARHQQEELRRKLLEMQKKKQQEEQERAEAEKRRQKEREMQLEEERRLLAEMAEEQRLEYERRKQEEEERVRHEAEERRRREEEEARLALEEAKRQALLLARQRADLEKEKEFQYKLLVEAEGLERRLAISRPWVYSYFQHPFLNVGDED
ncbi:uncharacterized protein KIAA2012 homolog isoform X1 [Zootoca vivipara]|uniref:uncharacterized protein KIAA2012 homolog isoform X1 n=1 Tax=Zootoca vivipara TaxID=8524 RepID=UPI00293BC289|nr:uncharacterized protein KIAA2012 homolog isoform X1 [Zootoca vivipara]